MKFVSCNNSSISEVHFVNSSQVHVLIEGCEGIHIENVLIEAPERSPNTDGIHISASHYVFVTNAIIATGKSFLKFFNFSFLLFWRENYMLVDIDTKLMMLLTGDDCVSIGDHTSNIIVSHIKCGPGHGIRSAFLLTRYFKSSVHSFSLHTLLLFLKAALAA